MYDLSQCMLKHISGCGDFYTSVIKPAVIISAGGFAGPGGAVSAVLCLYAGEELANIGGDAGDILAMTHTPTTNELTYMINNPYDYPD